MEKIITKKDLGIGQAGALGRFSANFMMRFLKFNKVNNLLEKIEAESVDVFAGEILKSLDISVQCATESIDNIPKSGGFLAVANFPHGVVDCFALLDVIGRKRKDVKFLINSELATLAIAKKFAIAPSEDSNFILAKEAVKFLQNGGVLIIFPAQKIATYSRFIFKPKDAEWNSTLLKFARNASVPIIPFYIAGRATKSTLLMTHFFSGMNSLLYVREMFKQKESDIEITVGASMSYHDIIKKSRVEKFKGSQQAKIVAETVRGVTYLQSIKLDEDYKAGQKRVFENPIILNQYDFATYSPILIKGGLSAYIIDNELVVARGDMILFVAKYSLHYFDNNSAANQMDSFADFEFNYRQLKKNIKSCVELSGIEVDFSALKGGELFLESSIKSLIKFAGVDVMVTTVRSVHRRTNMLTSAFIYYLETRYDKGAFSKAILARGITRHNEFVNHKIKSEVANFYSASLFSKYGSKIEPLEVSRELLTFVDMGSRVGSVSYKWQSDGSFERSFLIIL